MKNTFLPISMVILSLHLIVCIAAAGNPSTIPMSKKKVEAPSAPLSLRGAILQNEDRGTFLLYSAVEYRQNWEAPLSGIKGDLKRFGVIRLDYYVSRNVVIQIRGAVKQILDIEATSPTGAENLKRSSASDVGDFSIASLAYFFTERAHYPAFGLRMETTLPNTNQNNGLGTNTTDLQISLFGKKTYQQITLYADMGIGILTAPLNFNNQNDVFVYRTGILARISNRLQLAGEISGFHSTRNWVPIGTESRGIGQIGLTRNFRNVALEFFTVHGLNQREGDWGIILGLSTQVNFLASLLK
ncbi:MAG: hypothetical protein Kow0042_12970 [Calditrichia bacterium]